MLSQIRQISDGNYNTVFVKNKEQKFNLDKEIHDLECWKQSRNHVYRKEERELLSHLDKLKQQQEYLHHLDEERSGHVRGSHIPSQRRHTMSGSVPLSHHTSVLSPPGRESFQGNHNFYNLFMFVLGKLTNMPDHVADGTCDLWNASPMLPNIITNLNVIPILRLLVVDGYRL